MGRGRWRAGFSQHALMVARVSGTVGPEVLLVVITAQLPAVFSSPFLLRPILARIGRGDDLVPKRAHQFVGQILDSWMSGCNLQARSDKGTAQRRSA